MSLRLLPPPKLVRAQHVVRARQSIQQAIDALDRYVETLPERYPDEIATTDPLVRLRHHMVTAQNEID